MLQSAEAMVLPPELNIYAENILRQSIVESVPGTGGSCFFVVRAFDIDQMGQAEHHDPLQNHSYMDSSVRFLSIARRFPEEFMALGAPNLEENPAIFRFVRVCWC